MKIKVVDKEQKIEKLKQIIHKINSENYDLNEIEWEYILEALIQEAFRLEFGGSKNDLGR